MRILSIFLLLFATTYVCGQSIGEVFGIVKPNISDIERTHALIKNERLREALDIY